MEGRLFLLVAVIFFYLSLAIPSTQSQDEETFTHLGKEKVTQLHFFLNDILSGRKPSAVIVAHPNTTDTSPTPFGSVVIVDDPLTDGPDPTTANVIGNAQGLYVVSGQGTLSLLLAIDFGFTTGEYNGSSISVLSRNPVMEGDNRELSVVGGRGKFRLARGYALLKTRYLNVTNGDAIIEYNVTVLHY